MDYKGDIIYIDQVISGKTEAFSHLVEKHKDNAFNLAFRITGNREEAEEVTQDAFLKAFKSIKSFKMKSLFSTWLYRIVYNTAVSLVRARKKEVLLIEDFPYEVEDFSVYNLSDDKAEIDYRERLVNFALKKIEDEDRALISLYYYEEMSTEEISAVTGIGKSNIKVKLFRARQKMLRIIEKVENKKTIYHEQA
jgi:RNA polymerase sigma factor (sigma-70 family)